jgi:hypothetical protein
VQSPSSGSVLFELGALFGMTALDTSTSKKIQNLKGIPLNPSVYV